MDKGLVAISIIVAILVTYPFIANVSKISELKGSYVLKWSEVPLSKRATVYAKAMEINEKVNRVLKILLELAGLVVIALTVIEYYKFHKIYKEER